MCVRYKESHLVTARAAVTVIHPQLGCLISSIELQKYSIILLYAEEGCSPGQQSTLSLCTITSKHRTYMDMMLCLHRYYWMGSHTSCFPSFYIAQGINSGYLHLIFFCLCLWRILVSSCWFRCAAEINSLDLPWLDSRLGSMDSNLSLSTGPDWNILTTIQWIALKFSANIRGPQSIILSSHEFQCCTISLSSFIIKLKSIPISLSCALMSKCQHANMLI